MQESNNIDSALVQDMSSRMNKQAPVQAIPEVSSPHNTEVIPDNDVLRETNPPPVSAEIKQPETTSQPPSEPIKPAEKEAKPDEDATIDEYGNPIDKSKMYTEEEFNQRLNEGIRQRLARGKLAEQQPLPQQPKPQSEEFKVDPNSEDTWEVQLEAFIERTMDKRQAKVSEKQWQQQEAAKQAEFEDKFSTGMSKYGDFLDVVRPMVNQGKLTDSMFMATRALDNPAAFIYGASKLHPQELERIARIPDAQSQAFEIGRLHEKMVKAKVGVSNAPRPLEAPRGDMPAKSSNMPSLEDRIRQHAASKQARR